MSNHAINVSKCFRYFLGYRVVSTKSDTPDQPDEVDWPQYKGFWKDFKKILKDKST